VIQFKALEVPPKFEKVAHEPGSERGVWKIAVSQKWRKIGPT